MKNQATRQKLKAAGIAFTEETGFSSFHYTRFVFETRKGALQAEKALGMPISKFFKKYALTLY